VTSHRLSTRGISRGFMALLIMTMMNIFTEDAAKLCLLMVYAGNASTDHSFPLHICMQLVPEIDSVLNTQGHQKIVKL